MVEIKFLLCFTLSLLLLLPFSTSLPSHSVPDAVKTLWASNLTGMSLIMEYGGRRVTPTRSLSLTVFAPSDAFFERYGQPSLDQLHLHFSPLRLSLRTLRSLRDGTKIPTMTRNQFLVVTSNHTLSISGVEISDGSPLYDDGSLVIFKVDRVFDPDFRTPDGVYGNLHCSAPINPGFMGLHDGHFFKIVANASRSRGYNAMASFLDTQVGRVGDGALVTIFAPVDEALNQFSRQFDEFASLLLRHFVPCKITRRELAYLDDGVQLQTYVEGFKINITRSGDDLRLNGISMKDGDVFTSNWLVFHGIEGVLTSREKDFEGDNSKSSSVGFGGKKKKAEGYFVSSFIFWSSIATLGLYLFGFQ